MPLCCGTGMSLLSIGGTFSIGDYVFRWRLRRLRSPSEILSFVCVVSPGTLRHAGAEKDAGIIVWKRMTTVMR